MMRFADMEDNAMLGSNMSAISDLREAVHNVLPFFHVFGSRSSTASEETKAINPGVRGRAPSNII